MAVRAPPGAGDRLRAAKGSGCAISIKDVRDAATRISGHAVRTPVVELRLRAAQAESMLDEVAVLSPTARSPPKPTEQPSDDARSELSPSELLRELDAAAITRLKASAAGYQANMRRFRDGLQAI